MRHILGLAGFYRHFINNFAEITQPLTEALKGDNIKEKIVWTAEMQNSFELLKQKFAEYPVFQFPNFEQEFSLETDANLKRIAALLNQLRDGLVALVSCASLVLSKHERNYSIPELELLCVVWAIEHF